MVYVKIQSWNENLYNYYTIRLLRHFYFLQISILVSVNETNFYKVIIPFVFAFIEKICS
jgi:hypothetical protein